MRTCPVCDSNQYVLLGTLGNLTWFRCRKCGNDLWVWADQDDEP
jgi:hypothetical protein